MSAEVRLKQCQTALLGMGVKDVKFFFGNVCEKPLSQLASDAANVLEAVTGGNFDEMPQIQDSVRGKNT